MRIGVLAFQGSVREHQQSLTKCECEAVAVKTREGLRSIDGLVIPGGESTTVGKLLVRYGLDEEIRRLAREGLPIYGTCTGLILLAKEIVGSQQPTLGLMDIKVVRNAYGRQIDSFETDLGIPALGREPFRAVFIRAPLIESTGAGVETLAELAGKAVFARQGNLLVSAFHPELTGDLRIHRYFLDMVAASRVAS